MAEQMGLAGERLCVRGGLVYQPDGRFASADVWIRDGKIEQVSRGEGKDEGISSNRIDATGQLVIPGLVNAHFHSHGVLSRGSFYGAPLELWGLHATAGRARLDPEEVYTACQLACFEVLRLGTSALLDHTYFTGEQLDASIQAYADAGLRVNIAPCLSDRTYPETLPLTGDERTWMSQWEGVASDPDRLLQMCELLVQRWHGAENGRICIMAGSSAPHRCSEALLTGVAALASRHNLGIHTHLLETRIQALTAREFYGCDMTTYLDNVGLLGPKSSLAHGIWLTPEERSLIQRRKATVVHNPFSNVFLGSGVAPVTAMRLAGIPVALGTDGPNCGGSLNLFEAMRWAIGLQRLNDLDYQHWLTSSDALDMVWRGGAEALGLGGDIGVIAPGRKADLVLIDTHSPAFVPPHDLVEQMVIHFDGLVKTVIVDGQIIFADGRPTRFDAGAVLDKACHTGQRLRRRQETGYVAALDRVRRVTPVIRRLWRLWSEYSSGRGG